ncbi:hypothetical protein FA13DRAFT_1800754 [Coprinellus micaceus]|uniref:NADH dehydrogenase [ubiquinone] 1 alpha subcomplex subunit n=1 Tax=Coprinellus micaceus TaxID=71717 RepID=A0A4Y7SFW9_COPMI|nr:hypothetical protein FA13DRAFT_1800754 [Coprinellus micaceus]
MSFLSKVWAAIRAPRARFVGHDLVGNKFYELPTPELGRPKRSVVYRNPDDVWDYVGGNKRLAIQWSSWLAHTRPNAPTLEELQADAERMVRVRFNAAQIEARDREESERLRRIRSETHAQLIGAQSRVAQAEPAGPAETAASDATTHSPERRASQKSAAADAPEGKPNPWQAAGKAPETEAWTPQLRRRGN